MNSKSPNKLRHFHTISEMQHELGLPKPLHPLISLLDYSEVKITPAMLKTDFVMDFYNNTYNDTAGCSMRYGQTTYDFTEGGMSFTSPGQPLAALEPNTTSLGFTLLVHPDFLRNYPLETKIKNYGVFSYFVSEALYLSDQEKTIINTIASIIKDELKTSIDDLSQEVLISQLQLMLSYALRFYKRQFITRKIINNDLLCRVDALLDTYFNNENALVSGLPTVQYLSEALEVSAHYLGDMLRSLTGHNTQQHIHLKLIEKAKEKLSTTNLTVSQIAYELGFEHPQSFSKLFKSKTNQSPLEFRQLFN